VRAALFSVALLWLAHGSPASAEDLTGYTGPQLYSQFCASCHGRQGHGDGPVASSLKVEVPDLTRIAARQGGKFPDDKIRAIIDGRTILMAHGSRTMPIWGMAFRVASGQTPQAEFQTQAMIGQLMEFLRSIQHPPASAQPQ